jgi:hypothetical protein
MDINIHKKSIRVLLTHEKEIVYILERLIEIAESYPDSDIEKLANIAKNINDKF